MYIPHKLFEQSTASSYLEFSIAEYRPNSMIMDVVHYRHSSRILLPVFKLKFSNKGIYAVNSNKIFRPQKVQFCIPEYFTSKSTPRVSYTYDIIIASKLFNYKQTFQCIDLEHLRLNPPMCFCSSSPFKYSSAGHIISGDVDIVWGHKITHLKRTKV
jgi:hypothetical protein